MAPNTEAIVPQLRRDFEALVDYVSSPESKNHDAYTVELHLFRRLLALGAALLKLFFRTRAATRPPTPTTPEGRVMRYHGRRSMRYISIFGHLRLARHYFTAAGQASAAPLDAELSLPDTAFSDLLREWGAYGDTEQAYGETQLLLERILGLTLSLATLEQQARRSAQDVDAFYAQPTQQPAPAHTGSILVVQADGKGVPMVTATAREAARLATGRKRGTKKEALVKLLCSRRGPLTQLRRHPLSVGPQLCDLHVALLQLRTQLHLDLHMLRALLATLALLDGEVVAIEPVVVDRAQLAGAAGSSQTQRWKA